MLPLLHLGSKIGQGANCEVFEASLAQKETRGGVSAMGWCDLEGIPTRLAAKLYLTGHSSDRGAGAVMRDVMWEVHVLRQITHGHIVRICDTIELSI